MSTKNKFKKYNKDFLSIIFTDKKIKNLAKIRRPTQTHALGSKGQALWVFAIISTLRYAQVVFWQKNLDSPIRPPNVKAIFFFFFFFFFLSLFWG
jgi:phosphate starvation-inducible membrane PsiE